MDYEQKYQLGILSNVFDMEIKEQTINKKYIYQLVIFIKKGGL